MCSVLVWLWEGILTHLSTTSHKNITYPHLPHLHISSSLLLGVTDKLSCKRSMRTIKQYTSHITHLTLHKRHHVPHHIVNHVAAFCLYVSTREQISTLTHSHAHTHMYTHTYIHTPPPPKNSKDRLYHQHLTYTLHYPVWWWLRSVVCKPSRSQWMLAVTCGLTMDWIYSQNRTPGCHELR